MISFLSPLQLSNVLFASNIAYLLGTLGTQNDEAVDIKGGTIANVALSNVTGTVPNATNAVNVTGTVGSSVTGTTQTAGDNSTKIATTAYVKTATDNLGLGTMSTQNSNNVSITGGAITGSYGLTAANATNAANATLATKASTLAQNGGTGTGMTFNWSGQSGQPTWLWGGNDGTNMYVYNPSNFNVSYANSAGTSDHITNSAYNGYGIKTVSSSGPSGGSDGDIWYQV